MNTYNYFIRLIIVVNLLDCNTVVSKDNLELSSSKYLRNRRESPESLHSTVDELKHYGGFEFDPIISE